MITNARIQPSPVDRLSCLESEAFSVGPGLAVDRRNLRRSRAERNFPVPDTDDEDTVRCGDARRVDDEGSGQLGFDRGAPLQWAVRGGGPVVISARFTRFKTHVLGRTGLQSEGVLVTAGPFVQAMNRGRH